MAARIPLPDEFHGRAFLFNNARAKGVGRSRLAGSDLLKPFWGIRATVQGDDVEAVCLALALRMPPHAFFTHATAAQLMRLPLPRRLESTRPLHVGIAEPGRAMDARDIVGHRLRVTPAEIVAWGDLRHTGPARTWLDLAAALSLVELVAVGDHIVHREHPIATVNELTEALASYPSRRGLVRARAALPMLRVGAESPRESALRVIIVLAGLPEPECNVNIFDSQGRFLARGDLVYPLFKLLLEYQGDHHRTDRAQWRRDIRRVQSVEDNGWQILQFTDDDLRNPAELVARIERRLRARGWVGRRGRQR